MVKVITGIKNNDLREALIAKEEFLEGSKIYGRSVMASEYNVSPETIRRALKLLHDMKVVEIKPQSGATVLSIDNAKRYIQQFEDDSDVQSLKMQLKDINSHRRKTIQ